jgi:methionyl-tRNA formyltransferase
MRVVFMGTPEFATYTLQALIDNGYDVVAVISQPDKPKGRGKKLQPTPVKSVAQDNNLPVYQPERIKSKEFEDFLAEIEADVFVVVAYGQILSERILNMPRLGCINVHGSLLPAYRGPAPIQYAVLNGDKVTGVTTMFMDKQCDTGDILLTREIALDEGETYGSLHDKMAPIGAELLISTLKSLENGEITPEKQDNSIATHTKMIEKSMGHIDWTKSSAEIYNLVHGLNPMPGAYTSYNGDIIKIWNCVMTDIPSDEAGTIAEADCRKGLLINTGDVAVKITELQAVGSKRMKSEDYLRGHSIEVGALLS